jgi:hypothetical protein
MTTAPDTRPDTAVQPDLYIVLNADDRLSYVSAGFQDDLGGWIGHVLWDHLPGAREIFGPGFDEARATGRSVERVVFYAGRVKRLTAIPAPDGLAVHVERLATLDVTTLGTLAQSLAQIAEALDAREPAQPDSRAHASLRALP